MLRKFHYGARFEETHQDFTRKPASTSWSLATALSAIRDALGEGLAAHRQYEHLKSRGMSQDTALKVALGVRNPAGEVPTAPSHRASKRLRGRQLCLPLRSDSCSAGSAYGTSRLPFQSV
jgi:hypothetical protein